MKIDSENLFRTFEQAAQDAKERILNAAGGEGSVHLTFWFGYAEPYMNLEYSKYPYEEKVKGVHLEDMVEELIRRITFVKRQQTLKLGAPIVEATVVENVPEAPYDPPEEVTLKAPVEEDDEIPF